ncbi:MAG: hypothetical protein ACFB9N_10750 [Geitlerinemataceae cyanobacterium]
MKIFNSQLFLASLILTIGVWVLRGFGILTFLPGLVIWVGIFATVGIGIVTSLRNSQRW